MVSLRDVQDTLNVPDLRALLPTAPGSVGAQASDYPPGPYEPMMALQSEVTRTDITGTSPLPASSRQSKRP